MRLMPTTRDLNVQGFAPLPPPAEIHGRLPITDAVAQHVLAARAQIERVLTVRVVATHRR
jgi:3-deoxy-7-phosphoheptulonate synthase